MAHNDDLCLELEASALQVGHEIMSTDPKTSPPPPPLVPLTPGVVAAAVEAVGRAERAVEAFRGALSDEFRAGRYVEVAAHSLASARRSLGHAFEEMAVGDRFVSEVREEAALSPPPVAFVKRTFLPPPPAALTVPTAAASPAEARKARIKAYRDAHAARWRKGGVYYENERKKILAKRSLEAGLPEPQLGPAAAEPVAAEAAPAPAPPPAVADQDIRGALDEEREYAASMAHESAAMVAARKQHKRRPIQSVDGRPAKSLIRGGDLACELGVDTHKLAKWARAGKVWSYKAGRNTRYYDRAEVLAFIGGKRVGYRAKAGAGVSEAPFMPTEAATDPVLKSALSDLDRLDSGRHGVAEAV